MMPNWWLKQYFCVAIIVAKMWWTVNIFFSILQKECNASKRDTVVLLLQDMLEVVTRDMMLNEIRLVNSLTKALQWLICDAFHREVLIFFTSMLNTFVTSELVELGHGNKDSVPRRQLFAGTGSKSAILFPPPMTAQWEEQVHCN